MFSSFAFVGISQPGAPAEFLDKAMEVLLHFMGASIRTLCIFQAQKGPVVAPHILEGSFTECAIYIGLFRDQSLLAICYSSAIYLARTFC